MFRKMPRNKQPVSSDQLKIPSSLDEVELRDVPAEGAKTPNRESDDDKRLDEALEQTFPASDPISL